MSSGVSGHRPPIPEHLRRAVLLQASHRCAIPLCRQIPVEIAHIVPFSIVQKHDFGNLIALCPTCHTRYDHGNNIDRQSMFAYKRKLPRVDAKTVNFLRGRADLNRKPIEQAARFALRELLRLQYPWGEWADFRTPLQRRAAERSPRYHVQGPKPNVARTIFAVEALKLIDHPAAEARSARALDWLKSGISDSWYKEWTAGTTLESEGFVPHLYLRRDVRHTAQAVSALARWDDSRDPLSNMTYHLAESILPNGFWPETPGSDERKLLASVYAVEALGHVAGGSFRLPIQDLLNRSEVKMVEDSLQRGISALRHEAEEGGGLLGHSFIGPTSYLSGIALFRLTAIPNRNQQGSDLIKCLIRGLQNAATPEGWYDESLPAAERKKMRRRATLRVAAGLMRAKEAGFQVQQTVLDRALELMLSCLQPHLVHHLDAPDYSCALMTCFGANSDGCARAVSNMILDQTDKSYWPAWQEDLRAYRKFLSEGERLAFPAYTRLAEILDERISRLNKEDQA